MNITLKDDKQIIELNKEDKLSFHCKNAQFYFDYDSTLVHDIILVQFENNTIYLRNQANELSIIRLERCIKNMNHSELTWDQNNNRFNFKIISNEL